MPRTRKGQTVGLVRITINLSSALNDELNSIVDTLGLDKTSILTNGLIQQIAYLRSWYQLLEELRVKEAAKLEELR